MVVPDIFPDPQDSNEYGVVAVGGELIPEVVLSAYLKGIFPWFSDDDPVIWWCPDPRFVLWPDQIKFPKSLKQLIRKDTFEVRYDTAFDKVICNCSDIKRKGQEGTWITEDMISVYNKLFRMGYAHSVEVYQNDALVGGLYGLLLGEIFCGESMFHKVSNASKVAFYYLVKHLKTLGCTLIDAQVETDHLKQFGAENIERNEFLEFISDRINLNKSERWV
jgi:leucyl/phenylalanyl-tRNA--protein transferase